MVVGGLPGWGLVNRSVVLTTPSDEPAGGRIAAPAQAADEIINRLFAAYGSGRESEAYSILEPICSPEMTRRLYLECAAALESSAESGGAVTIADVEVISAEPDAPTEQATDDSAEFDVDHRVRCEWRFRADTRHWGHVHSEFRRQVADLTLTAEAGHWKLDRVEPWDRSHEG